MLALLRQVTPTLHDTEFIWILVTVNSASVGMQLSPEVAAAIPKVVERVRQELRRGSGADPLTGAATEPYLSNTIPALGRMGNILSSVMYAW